MDGKSLLAIVDYLMMQVICLCVGNVRHLRGVGRVVYRHIVRINSPVVHYLLMPLTNVNLPASSWPNKTWQRDDDDDEAIATGSESPSVVGRVRPTEASCASKGRLNRRT